MAELPVPPPSRPVSVGTEPATPTPRPASGSGWGEDDEDLDGWRRKTEPSPIFRIVRIAAVVFGLLMLVLVGLAIKRVRQQEAAELAAQQKDIDDAYAGLQAEADLPWTRLRFETEPAGAVVKLRGDELGTTPLDYQAEEAAGERLSFRIESAGFKTQSVDVLLDGKRQVFFFELEKRAVRKRKRAASGPAEYAEESLPEARGLAKSTRERAKALYAEARKLIRSDPGAAASKLHSVLKLNPKAAGAHRLLGVHYANQGKVSAACRHLRSFVRISPNHSQAGAIRGQLERLGCPKR